VTSVLSQTYSVFELIVVLDGSDPNTVEVLSRFQDARLNVVCLPRSVGPAEARNIGVSSANGKWIAFLDDDDEWLPTKLEKQVIKAQEAKGDHYVVVCEYLKVIEGVRHISHLGSGPKRNEPLSEMLFSWRGFQTIEYMAPRRLLLQHKLTDVVHDDWDWFLRIAALEGFELLIVKEPLVKWHVHFNRRVSSSTTWKQSLEWAKSMSEYMTGRAYSMFIIRISLDRAMQEGARVIDKLLLLREAFGSKHGSLRLAAEALMIMLVPKTLRDRLPSSSAGRVARRLYQMVVAGTY
jgi:glycosyltransferase involved in cell wall biosynthesis